MKRMINNLYYKLRFARKHLKIGKSAHVLGRTSTFEGYNKIGVQSRFHGSMGYGSYIGESSRMNATIGRYTCIGDRVYTLSGAHPTKDFVSIHPAFYSNAGQAGFTFSKENCFQERLLNPVDGKTAVYIGNDVWIGSDVTILGGVKIGNGAIIAAGSVVTQDVEPYTIVGSVPAKPIRRRFNQAQIDFLEEFCWWNKPQNWLKENCEDMKNIEFFMKKYSK